MIVNESYGFRAQPLLQDPRWGPGEGGRRNNNSEIKNANRQQTPEAGAGQGRVPYAGNQLYHYAPGPEGFGRFCNGGAHLPLSRMPDMHASHRRPPPPRAEDGHFYRTVETGGPRGCGQMTELRDACRDEGPFVFGVHSPSQFEIAARFQNDDTYDYADVADDKSVIDNESENLYCDRKINIIPSARTENGETKRNMFRIDDTRTRKKDKRSAADRKKGRKQRMNEGKDMIKCVLVGDGAVGKTSLITSYAQNTFQSDYKPTTFDNYNVVVEVDGRPISVELCDTAGQDSLKGLRELCYPGTDVIMLCFSVMKPDTFRNVASRWAPTVAAIGAPLVLVGTQADLRDCTYTARELKAQCESPVSESEARVLAAKLNAPYIETSSKTKTRLKDAFDSAILAALPVNKKKKSFWKKIFCIS